MKFTDGWIDVVAVRPDLIRRSKTRGIIKNWFEQHQWIMMRDWVYSGYKKGIHRFKVKDPKVAMLFKLTFN